MDPLDVRVPNPRNVVGLGSAAEAVQEATETLLDWSTSSAPVMASPHAAAVLRAVAATADQLTTLLDLLSGEYSDEHRSVPEPLAVTLDQAAAAAHDLSVTARSAVQSLDGCSAPERAADPSPAARSK